MPYSLPNAQNITRTVLKNGIVILVYENHAAQSVVVTGSYRAGSLYDPPDKNGVAALTAASLLRGTQTRDFAAIASALEDVAADLDFGAGVHRASFGGKALAEDLPLLADLLADLLRCPAFPAAQIERLRGEILTGLRIRAQDTRFRARRAFSETLYPPDHPYHRSISGTPESVSAITLEDLRDFHARHYGPQGLIITVVGAIHAAEAIETLRARLEDWQNPNQPPEPALPTLSPLTGIQRVTVPLSGKTQSDLVLGTWGPSRRASDYHAAVLVNCVLGQFGMMGRIGEIVREKLGLAYYASSSLEGGMGATPWSVSAGVNPANLELAINSIVGELRRITETPVSETDLAQVQSYFVGSLPRQLESSSGIAGTILSIELYNLGLDYLLSYRDRIYQQTREDLLAAAQRYLSPEAYVIGVSGPA